MFRGVFVHWLQIRAYTFLHLGHEICHPIGRLAMCRTTLGLPHRPCLVAWRD